MTDLSQQNLREPEKVDWDNYGKSSSYVAPPPAVGPDGKAITYKGIAESVKVNGGDQEGFLQILIDPIKLVQSGKHDGYTIRFTRASVAPYTKLDPATGKRVPKKGNPNAVADFLRACGLAVKPQTNADYIAAVNAAASGRKVFPFTVDWEAYSKDTGESVKGYMNFPDDPDRPGEKKAILKRGDRYTVSDRKGNILESKTVESEVLFANARLRFFQDPTRQRG